MTYSDWEFIGVCLLIYNPKRLVWGKSHKSLNQEPPTDYSDCIISFISYTFRRTNQHHLLSSTSHHVTMLALTPTLPSLSPPSPLPCTVLRLFDRSIFGIRLSFHLSGKAATQAQLACMQSRDLISAFRTSSLFLYS